MAPTDSPIYDTSSRTSDWPPLQLVVYDLDGTLVDAFTDIANALNAALRRTGLPELPPGRITRHVGDGADNLVRRCLNELEAAERFDDVFPAYMEVYTANPIEFACCYPGVLEALEAVRGAGLRQAIVTNKPESITQACCRKLGLSERVDLIRGEAPERPRKPDPEAIRAVASDLGVAPAAMVMVGDYRADHEVARRAGCRMLGVTWGLFDRARTEAERPWAIAETAETMRRILSEAAGGAAAPL